MKKLNLTKRQEMLLEKAIDCLNDVGGYSVIDFTTKGYDGTAFDPMTLSDDLQIEFELE